MSGDGYMERLRRDVRKTIAGNAVALARHGARPGAAQAPEKQWWNVGAKKAAGERIADEEYKRTEGHRNDELDALRHARWSQRMATEIDPAFANLAGVKHEIDNVVGSVVETTFRHATGGKYMKPEEEIVSIPQTIAESIMDLKNNREGLRAARETRPIDRSRLTIRPISPSGQFRGAPQAAEYDPEARYFPYRKR